MGCAPYRLFVQYSGIILYPDQYVTYGLIMSRPFERAQLLREQLFIFGAALEAHELAVFYCEADDDRAAADAAVLDVFLAPGRTVDEHVDLLTAVGTTDRFRL